ncbi:MAG: glutathione S-transferase N-terminal domain-containing protein [Pseudomonadota bacterium]|nr:glutathione S-transferase N-terminal domain-containing protein [Pseudomonadota bacterium]
MRLFYSPNSPYARFTRLVLRHHGLQDRVSEVELHPFDNPKELMALNPLCKVPTLELDDGAALFDSEVIALYLDRHLGDGSLSARLDADWGQRARFSLAKGLVDSAVMLRGENWRGSQEGEHASPFFVARHRAAIDRTLAYFSDLPAAKQESRANLPELLIAVAVSYIEFRHPDVALNPALYDRYLGSPPRGFAETAPTG